MREKRGKEIAERIPDQIRKINKTKFMVKSQTKENEEHMVRYDKSFGWICTCNDYTYRQKKCKHIFALEYRGIIKEKKKATPTWIIPKSNYVSCPFCGSREFSKYGYRYNKKRKEQRYICSNLDCRRKFTADDEFKKRKHVPDTITYAMELYFWGLSLRTVTRILGFKGTAVSHMTVYRWIAHYMQLMQKYLDANIQPIVGSTWRADEIFLKIRGHQKYVFMSMDDKTRFWISKEIADTKFHHDARRLLAMTKDVTKTKPAVFITDGSPVYDRAFNKEYREIGKDTLPIHVNTIHMAGNWNNNMMERLNGELKHMVKPMRGIKITDTPMIPGYQLFHNYFRSHSSLNGKTPAEEAGIRIEGNNKWKTVIQNATKNITPKQYSITEFFENEIKIPISKDENGDMNMKSC